MCVRGMGTRRGALVPPQGISVVKAASSKDTAMIMELINDDLVLVILDFVDVQQILTTVARSSQRLHSITR